MSMLPKRDEVIAGVVPAETPSTDPICRMNKGFYAKIKAVFSSLATGLWVVFVLFWPVLKWLLSIEVFFQLTRMIYYWDTPEMNAGWAFLLHFFVLSVLTYFVALAEPKDS